MYLHDYRQGCWKACASGEHDPHATNMCLLHDPFIIRARVTSFPPPFRVLSVLPVLPVGGEGVVGGRLAPRQVRRQERGRAAGHALPLQQPAMSRAILSGHAQALAQVI